MIVITMARTAVVTIVACVSLVGGSSAAVAAPSTPREAPATPSQQAGGTLTPASSSSGPWTAGGLIETTAPPVSRAVAASSGFAQVGGCTFYASSSSAGGFCSAGGVTGVVQTLEAWLAGREFHPCRYTELPEGMVVNAPAPDGGRWMLRACFEGYDLSQPWGGTDISVEIRAQWVKDENRGETEIPGYMEEFWVVQSSFNYYPLPRINTAPSTPFRVGTYSFFWATWVEALDSSEATEPEFRIAYPTTTQGTVYLHAEVANVRIHPGVEGMEPVDCGAADIPFEREARDSIPRSEGGDQESDCWTVYEHSTATAERLSVRMEAEVTWQVRVEDGAGNPLADLGEPSYTMAQRVSVAEVQPLTDW
jgi:hypothetical protein